MIGKQGLPFEGLPVEFRIRLPPDDEESIALVDLREMHRQRLDPLFSWLPIGRDRRLHDVDPPVAQQGIAPLLGTEHTVGNFVPLVSQELDASEQRAVESGVARRHNADEHAPY